MIVPDSSIVTIELHSQQLYCVEIQVYCEMNKGMANTNIANEIHDIDFLSKTAPSNKSENSPVDDKAKYRQRLEE